MIMSSLLLIRNPLNGGGGSAVRLALAGVVLLCAVVPCFAQGTMVFRFEVAPRGTGIPVSSYTESGMHFWNPRGPQGLVLLGGGIPSLPENDTGYLRPSAGGTLAFSFNTSPFHTFFGLVSFDLAESGTTLPGPVTLDVVGYGGQGLVVTNTITTDGINDGTGPLQDFETFHLGSEFANVYRIDIFSDRFSIDNLVISGVPEPRTGALAFLGLALALGHRALGRGRRQPAAPACPLGPLPTCSPGVMSQDLRGASMSWSNVVVSPTGSAERGMCYDKPAQDEQPCYP